MLLAMSDIPVRGVLVIGQDEVDLGTLRVISRRDQPRLTSKAAAVLSALASRPGQTLSRSELLDRVWPDTCPTPDVLTQAIAELRRTLDDDQRSPWLIETVPKRGYRLIASVQWRDIATVKAAEPVPAPHAQSELQAADIAARATRVASAGPGSRSKRTWVVIAAALAILGMVVGGRYVPRRDDQPRVVHGDPLPLAGTARMLTRGPGREGLPQISPDATQVIYSVGNGELETSYLMMQGVDSPEAFTLQSATDNEVDARWSPDGRRIAYQSFTSNSCSIRVRPALGGMARTIAPCEWEVLSQFDWLPDGEGIISSSLRGEDPEGIRLIVHRIGSAPVPLDYPRQQTDHDLSPRYSPDGRWLAFRRGRNPYSDLYLMEVGKPESLRRLTDLNTSISGFDWLPDNASLLASLHDNGENGLHRIAIDDGAIVPLGIAPAVRPDVARNKAVAVYEVPRQNWNIVRVDATSAGVSTTDFMSSTANDVQPSISPDGRTFAFTSDRSGEWQVWLHDVENGRSVPLTNIRRFRPNFPEWRPDGRAVVFVAQVTSQPQAFEVDVDSGALTVVSPPELTVVRATYHSDGRLLLIGRSANGDEGAFVVDPEGGWELLVRNVLFADVDARTGRIYANFSDRPGIYEIGAGTLERLPLAEDERRELRWFIEGSRIVYQSMKSNGDHLRAYDLDSGEDEQIVDALLPPFNRGTSRGDFRGHRYATVLVSDSSDVAIVNLDPAPARKVKIATYDP
jgi:Tol biopolymer transport system component/DNA-binding winged helix-turn-helix (wHTH) protein